MLRSSACCAQLGSKATRAFRTPSAGWFPGVRIASRRPRADKFDQIAQAQRQHAGKWSREGRQPQRQRKTPRVGQELGNKVPEHTLAERAAVIVLDIVAGDVDEMRVVDLHGARRHARQAGQAAIEMMHRFGVGRTALFQHGADQIDAAARRVVLVAGQHIGRAGRGAEAVVHAGFQDAVGLGDLRLCELFECESGLHVRSTSIEPSSSMSLRSLEGRRFCNSGHSPSRRPTQTLAIRVAALAE
jgi:hypothetical protein